MGIDEDATGAFEGRDFNTMAWDGEHDEPAGWTSAPFDPADLGPFA